MKVLEVVQADKLKTRNISKIIVASDLSCMALVWDYVLEQKGMSVLLKLSVEKTVDDWSIEMPGKVRNCSH
jgi:hypothetical protein